MHSSSAIWLVFTLQEKPSCMKLQVVTSCCASFNGLLKVMTIVIVMVVSPLSCLHEDMGKGCTEHVFSRWH